MERSDQYECPAGERLTYRFSRVEAGKGIARYWTSACTHCAIKAHCTTGTYRRVSRWIHEDVLERAEKRQSVTSDVVGLVIYDVKPPCDAVSGSIVFRPSASYSVAMQPSLTRRLWQPPEQRVLHQSGGGL